VSKRPEEQAHHQGAGFFNGLFETAHAGARVPPPSVPAAAKDTRVGFAELARRPGILAFSVSAIHRCGSKAEAAPDAGNIDAAVNALERTARRCANG
jgi:hypothetical protein